MKLLKCTVANFGSYKDLTFDFTNTGLSLIYGPTGAGKSTIMDAVAWTLFGTTARGGNVDDVKSWSAEGELTRGEIEVDIGAFNIRIIRIRGKGAQNDLYWKQNYQDDERRGKDLTDTQKLIESQLGITSDQYFTGAYFSEFSPTSTFFLDKPKARREVFENIADLSLPVRLGQNVSEARKVSKKALEQIDLSLSKTSGALESAKANELRAKSNLAQWAVEHAANLRVAEERSNSFEDDKRRTIDIIANQVIDWDEQTLKETKQAEAALRAHVLPITPVDPMRDLHADLDKAKSLLKTLSNTRCGECGGAIDHANKDKIVRNIQDIQYTLSVMDKYTMEHADLSRRLHELKCKTNPHDGTLQAAKKETNPYLGRIEQERTRENPHQATLNFATNEIRELMAKGAALLEDKLSLEARTAALTHLYELSYTLRAKLLKNAVAGIQEASNRVLRNYFDSELQVEFKMEDGDSLDVYIQKNGNPCNYKQLSKGQRGLLKLAFISSVMQASADSQGIHFDTLFFDESLDGMDSTLKTKAFALFQDLSKNHGTILVIDHAPEFQALFDNKYSVRLEGDNSVLVEE